MSQSPLDIDRLIRTEPHHSPPSDYLLRCRHGSIDSISRQDSISWILKVHAHYHFRPVTALLSVNYFDRFLSFSSSSSTSLPWTEQKDSGWAFQLLSVACLSLAAKLEEPYVPLLIDLQLFSPRFVFDPQTVQRMELLVMSHLNWRLRSITPFDFLPYFVSHLRPLACIAPPESDPFPHIVSTSSNLILNTTRVIDFLAFSPSIIAAAVVISAAGGSVDLPESFYNQVNKEVVRSCHQLMEEYLIDECPSADDRRVEELSPQPSPPRSPTGVLDAAACGSFDTRSGSPRPASGQESGTGISLAEPPNKWPPPDEQQ